MNREETSFCWWRHGIIYHIYPQSYQDTNNDGTGDLPGIIQQLDYLKGLGVDAIWLSPIYDSPLIDGGYDIKDYYTINPIYGDLNDFKELLKQAHQKGIRVIMDMVLNHTSQQHPWFIQSKASADNPRREWYLWRAARKGKRPNNWITNFCQSAWTLDPTTQEYYYHSFFSDQPDLNWRNPDVRTALFEVLKFWLDLGVDGFRLDVINMLFKHPEFPNHNLLKLYFSNRQVPNRNQPEVYRLLKELRSLLDSYENKVSIGEIYAPPPGNSRLANSFLGNGKDMLHLAFDFSLVFTSWNARKFYQIIHTYYHSLPPSAWPCFVISNHDLGRHIKPHPLHRFRKEKAKVMAALLLTLKGTPFIYYGDEIGMENGRIPRKEMKDRYGKLFYPFYKGRDRYRTPMQWNARKYAGFSQSRPWLPVHKNYKTVNVEQQSVQKDSLLHLYQQLIVLRKRHRVLQYGELIFLNRGENGVLAYKRVYQNETITVVLNFTAAPKSMQCLTTESVILFPTSQSAFCNNQAAKEIGPFGIIILQTV